MFMWILMVMLSSEYGIHHAGIVFFVIFLVCGKDKTWIIAMRIDSM